MKKYNIFIFLLVGIFLIGCSEKDQIILSFTPTAGKLLPNTLTYDKAKGAYVLDKNKASVIASTFKTETPDLGTNLTKSYILEIDKAGNNFKNAQVLDSICTDTVSPSFAVTVANLNKPIASSSALNCAPGVRVKLEMRLKTRVALYSPVYSNVDTFSVIPYPTYGILYVPGNYQGTYPGGSWNPANPNTIIYSQANNGKYEGYLDMSNSGVASQFKFAENPDWSVCWKAENLADAVPNATFNLINTTGDPNISMTAGYYKFNVDLKAHTCTNVLINKWGVIGSFAASGWSNEVNMTLDPTTKLWSATVTLAVGDEFKVRANGGWDINYGITNGKCTAGGDNIKVTTAGTYTVTLDLRQYGSPGYFLTYTKN
jgi:hypothetical protein